MADIAVTQTADTHEPSLPLWAALLGLSAIIVTVWLLFMLGLDAAPAASAQT